MTIKEYMFFACIITVFYISMIRNMKKCTIIRSAMSKCVVVKANISNPKMFFMLVMMCVMYPVFMVV